MTYKKKTLPNGLRIITVPMKENPTVTVMVLVEAGSKYETKDINGISHFLEHMCFKGTVQRPTSGDINRELDSLGAVSNAFTGTEYTGYWSKGRSKDFVKIFDVIADIYLNSTFPAEEIEKERGVILDEMNMYEDLPMRKVQNVFAEALYGDQPAGWTILGLADVIKSVKREDFIAYREKHYVAQATAIIVAGGVEHGDVVALVQKLFKNISTGRKQAKKKTVDTRAPSTSKQEKPFISHLEKKTDQTHLILGVRSHGLEHKDLPTLRLIAGILGKGMSSRLFQRLRDEMGVGYYVRADQDSSTDHGVIEISTGVVPHRVSEVILAILEELRRIAHEDVNEKELKKAKDYHLGTMMLELETSDQHADWVGSQEILLKNVEKPEDYARKIRAVTVKDIKRVAQKMLVDDMLNLAYVGPASKEDLSKILTLRG